MTAFGIAENGPESSRTENFGDWAACGITLRQRFAVGVLIAIAAVLAFRAPGQSLGVIHILVVVAFASNAISKLFLAAIGKTPSAVPAIRQDQLPDYTIIVPLYREGAVVRQLITALGALDYPRDRLQIILVIEQDDDETLGALARLCLPEELEVLVKPPGGPQTKPNALNAALVHATGEFVVVYDAEDIPHPVQLHEAAARFRADDGLACLQAPLRISNPQENFLTQQFALEYAGQFEGVIPGLVRLGIAFPLGGTSNHLRASVLRRLGGWDAYNVTEDADLGLRLGVAGQRMGVLLAPTSEAAPDEMAEWLPQRARWVKGYMQTWGVRMRQPWAGGIGGFLLLQATLGVAIMSAALHGPLILLLNLALLDDITTGAMPAERWRDLAILGGGWAAAVMATTLGAARAGQRMGLREAVACLGYWPLQTLAFASAVHQLATDPHRWDKTPHRPVAPTPARRPLDVARPWSVSPAA